MDGTKSPTVGQSTPTVRVRRHQAYDMDLRIEILPARQIVVAQAGGCRPRRGGERIDKDPVELPEETRSWLLGSSDRLIAWLAREDENRRAFIADPLRALESAGVEPSRATMKALARARATFGRDTAAPPGLQLRSVQATVKKKGRVRRVKGDSRDWEPPALRDRDDDCGCGAEGGE